MGGPVSRLATLVGSDPAILDRYLACIGNIHTYIHTYINVTMR
jgi:hypothetical protein